jgi:hypothetical protein
LPIAPPSHFDTHKFTQINISEKRSLIKRGKFSADLLILCGKGEDEKKDGEEFRKYLMKNAILPHAF